MYTQLRNASSPLKYNITTLLVFTHIHRFISSIEAKKINSLVSQAFFFFLKACLAAPRLLALVHEHTYKLTINNCWREALPGLLTDLAHEDIGVQKKNKPQRASGHKLFKE